MIILDRYEGDFAVLEEDGALKNVPRNLLDDNIKEGSVIIKKENKYILDKEKTAARLKRIAELQKSLFKN